MIWIVFSGLNETWKSLARYNYKIKNKFINIIAGHTSFFLYHAEETLCNSTGSFDPFYLLTLCWFSCSSWSWPGRGVSGDVGQVGGREVEVSGKKRVQLLEFHLVPASVVPVLNTCTHAAFSCF